MSETPAPLPIQETAPKPQMQDAITVVNEAFLIPRIQIPGSRAVLITDDSPQAKEYTPQDIRALTPVDMAGTETNLPTALQTNLEQIAQSALDDYTFSRISTDVSITAPVRRLQYLSALIKRATHPEFTRALQDVGIHPRPQESGKMPDVKWHIAAIQAALLEEAQELVTAQQAEAADEHTHRGEVYNVMRTDEKSTELTGDYRVTVDRDITFSTDKGELTLPTSFIFMTLRETLNTAGKPPELLSKERRIGQQVAALLNKQFGDVQEVHDVIQAYRTYLDDPSHLSQSEREMLQKQADYATYRSAEGGHFLRKAQEAHEDRFKLPTVDTTVKEDLMAAQQIVNSLVPPSVTARLAQLEYARDPQLIAERRKIYKAILFAEQVKPDNLTGYESNNNEIQYTQEEQDLGKAIRKRAYEYVDYQDYMGQNRRTLRSEMNAIDANRLALQETLAALGHDSSRLDWQRIQNEAQTVSLDQTADHQGKNRSLIREKMQETIIQQLGLDEHNEDHNRAIFLIQNRLRTELRLLGFQKELASRFPNLPENLVLTIFKDMGLKGVELLYRRSLDLKEKPEEVTGEIPPDLDRTIRLMIQTQEAQHADVIDQLEGLDLGDDTNTSEETPPPAAVEEEKEPVEASAVVEEVPDDTEEPNPAEEETNDTDTAEEQPPAEAPSSEDAIEQPVPISQEERDAYTEKRSKLEREAQEREGAIHVLVTLTQGISGDMLRKYPALIDHLQVLRDTLYHTDDKAQPETDKAKRQLEEILQKKISFLPEVHPDTDREIQGMDIDALLAFFEQRTIMPVNPHAQLPLNITEEKIRMNPERYRTIARVQAAYEHVQGTVHGIETLLKGFQLKDIFKDPPQIEKKLERAMKNRRKKIAELDAKYQHALAEFEPEPPEPEQLDKAAEELTEAQLAYQEAIQSGNDTNTVDEELREAQISYYDAWSGLHSPLIEKAGEEIHARAGTIESFEMVTNEQGYNRFNEDNARQLLVVLHELLGDEDDGSNAWKFYQEFRIMVDTLRAKNNGYH